MWEALQLHVSKREMKTVFVSRTCCPSPGSLWWRCVLGCLGPSQHKPHRTSLYPEPPCRHSHWSRRCTVDWDIDDENESLELWGISQVTEKWKSERTDVSFKGLICVPVIILGKQFLRSWTVLVLENNIFASNCSWFSTSWGKWDLNIKYTLRQRNEALWPTSSIPPVRWSGSCAESSACWSREFTSSQKLQQSEKTFT